ncbi:hypothetical protein KBB08_00125 [Candidatus Gracilibacteria bacterium]|nr:hypothetical protein [Candidatus Gracilibacteria bacterium]
MQMAQSTISSRVQQAARLLVQYWKPFLLFPFLISLAAGIITTILATFGIGGSLLAAFGTGNIGNAFAGVGVSVLIIVAISILAVIISTIVPIKATQEIEADKVPNFSELIQFAMNNIGRYISVVWHLFLYAAWPLLLIVGVIIAYAVVNLISGIIGLEISYVLNFILGLAGTVGVIALIIVPLVRGVYSIFTPYIALVGQKGGKESLQESIQLTKGKWVDVVFNILAYAIIGSIGAWIIGMIGSAIISIFGSPYTYTTAGQYTYNYLSLYNIGLVIVQSLIDGASLGFFTLCMYQYWRSLTTAAAPTAATPVTPVTPQS